MNLTLATVLSCTADGCQVQPFDTNIPLATTYSQKIQEYKIPIRPRQFVIIDNEPLYPETIFRFRRATVTEVEGERIELDDEGVRLLARRATVLQDELTLGVEVVLIGHTDENRRVIDIVVAGKPAHPEQMAADWFPQMVDYR